VIQSRGILILPAGSPSHVFVQKGEHIGLPNAHPEMNEVVPIVHRVPNGRIDLQTMRFTDLLAAGVQHLTGRERVVVLGVNDEDRHRDAVNGGEEPRSQPASPAATPSGQIACELDRTYHILTTHWRETACQDKRLGVLSRCFTEP
jgi:hypothetical protein